VADLASPAPPATLRSRDQHQPVEKSVWNVLVWLLDKRGLYCHCEYMTGTAKVQRLQIRVDRSDKFLLERAAAAAHLNVSAFVLQAAAARAEEVLAERPSIVLSASTAKAFNEALEQPAQVNERLAQALKRTRTFTWLD
jgi:uncharacterized protein (DUF1778 family)